MPPKGNRQDIHHVSFHFGKSRVIFSVSTNTTISSLKSTLLSSLPQIASSPPFPTYAIPTTTSDILLFRSRYLDDEPTQRIGFVSLEGGGDVQSEVEGVKLEDDTKGERKESVERTLKTLGWEKWVDLFVSFKDENGRFHVPEVTSPTLEDEEEEGDA